jgi:Fe-Mn family superoxide dismutase
MNAVVDLHSIEVPVGCLPVIVMDVWQHAYYKDYLRDVKTYSIAMMKELNWSVIEGRFKQSERVAQAMRAA